METVFKEINQLLSLVGALRISKFTDLKIRPILEPSEALSLSFPLYFKDNSALTQFHAQIWSTIASKTLATSLLSEKIVKTKKKLLIFDMDSTLINQEVIDELARAIGKYEEVARITEEAMQGNLPFSESLQRRCKLLQGLSIHEANNIIPSLSLSPGAEKLILTARNQGMKTAVVSGGFDFILRHFQRSLGLDHAYGNHLERDDDDAFTGNVLPPIVDAEYKKKLVANMKTQYGFTQEETLVAGDGANDILMMEEAGVSVSFCGKPKLNASVNTLIYDRNLRWIESFLG